MEYPVHVVIDNYDVCHEVEKEKKNTYPKSSDNVGFDYLFENPRFINFVFNNVN